VRRKDERELLDVPALRMREATITTGIWLTYLVGGLGTVYVIATWDRANRPLLGLVFVSAFLGGVAISLLPKQRIVRSRYREAFFLSWSLLDLVLIAVGTAADGGTASPIALVFFLPVIFASMSYPMGSVVAVGALTVVSYLVVDLISGGSAGEFQAAFVAALGCTAVMSAWQARNHNHQHAALAEASRTDPLTGCLNRRGFEERANAELSVMMRRVRHGALIVLDIDHFKPVNDRFGHAAGDELLCWVVERLGNVIRPEDAIGRLGGDEFAVLFPDIAPEHAQRSAQRISEVLAERAPASFGVAIFPEDGGTLETLTRRADMRLYASREGRPERSVENTLAAVAPHTEAREPAATEVDDVWRATLVMQAALLDQIDAAVVVTDPERTVMSWNTGAESLYGWSREEAVGRDAAELVLQPGGDTAEIMLAAMRREGRWDGEFVARRKDGSTFNAYTRNRMICDADGTVTAMVGVAVDITERVAAETELAQFRDYAQAVAGCMGEGLFTLDAAGRVTYINPVAEEMLGWERGELVGKVMHEMIHRHRPDGSLLPFDECPINRTLRDGVTARCDDELFIVRSGRGLPVSYTAAPFSTGEDVQGCVVIFQDISERKLAEADHRRDVETLAIIDRVEAAIVEGRFLLYAQPIVDLRSGRTVQHELLLRMREPDGEIVAPGAFLHVAEQYALIGEIDWWVIKRAAEIAAGGAAVELNISARSIGDLDVLEHIERSVERCGADPSLIVFEITETAIVEDEAAALRFAERLHALGCKLALDDFGTGYGGFTYLKQLPIDYLKIDIEFVRDLVSSSASRHVVQAVVALARDFSLQTVAEGVEDARTLALLRQLGVDFAQGYHIERPQPFERRPGDLQRSRGRNGAMRGLRGHVRARQPSPAA
jgi:diguanylate cyclase (GGDEF)-like protein/PAS domain S-box-containing protein